MNRLAPNFDPKFNREPLAPFINGRFVNYRYWQHPISDGSHLEDTCGFNSITVYIKHASRLALPVTIAGKTSVNLKNDHEGSIHDISLSAVEMDKEVFSLEKLSQAESIRLEFIRKGRYRLRYGLIESGNRKEASVDIVVR
ncbi:MAG: hypothetical protein O3A78_04405 [Nitrospinae bacterium]|jgi:hypothetical protein|nr:hypothetical protein [Nitrospinota bacterium]MDA1109047.1 hypothetical protein [Nitrospinota bacterium]